MPNLKVVACLIILPCVLASPLQSQTTGGDSDDVGRLIAAMLGDTPLIDDLQSLTDKIGGRATGSEANLRSVEWALQRFQDAGVTAQKEGFMMPALWLERSASATVRGEGVSFSPRVAAMPWSAGTTKKGDSYTLVDAGTGSTADFDRLGTAARGALLLVETPMLTDIAGLFVEYTEAAFIETRATAAGAAGVVYMASRPSNTLYRHNASYGPGNTRPMLIMERDAALRALRLIRSGTALTLDVTLDIDIGAEYESYNVIGEIRGSSKPDEIVIMGAHLDAWDLGTGALDNGANVAIMIDIARQMNRLGLQPARTVRLALWNGEEQGLVGSYGYTLSHADEMDDHVMAGSVDIGCGRISGFFTGGRPEIIPTLDRTLEPVKGLGPFQHIDVPIVGTDNYDFMMQGVANIVANHEPATYGPNYHARSDQFHQCDAHQLRLNAAIVAAVVYGFAEADVNWRRQTRAEIEQLIAASDLEQQMRTFGLWEAWENGSRGRAEGN
jgi:hypothetical protein